MSVKVLLLWIVVLCLGLQIAKSYRHGGPGEVLHVYYGDSEVRKPYLIDLRKFGESGDGGYHLRRSRRESTVPDEQSDLQKNVSIKVNPLNDAHAQLMVHWLGDGSDVMICLARDPPLSPMDDPKKSTQISPSSVYFSYDYGDTFINKTHLFKVIVNGTEQNSTLDQFLTHPKFDTIIFTDSRNKAIFHVPDKGDDIKRYMVDFTPSDISFYEHDAKTFLVLDKVDQERKLYYTTDAGATFNLLHTYVKSFSWSYSEDMPPHLYVERREPTNVSSVLFMDATELLQPDTKKEFFLLLSKVQDFYVKKDFSFAVKKAMNTSELWISYKRGPFIKADFQTELDIKGMHIADVEGKRIMVSAAHSDVISHLYVSESNSKMTVIKFVPSLENVFTFIPGIIWKTGWLVQTTEDAFTDLYKVEGLPGIYIASKVNRNPIYKSEPEGSVGPEHLLSVITFDHGAEWRPITAPKVDEEGQPINCTRECSLHLSQKFSSLYPVTRSVTIMSSKLAPGIIMASGVVGKSLKGHPGVFLSRDAGLTWRQVLKNYHFFNFGDHGGILVAVKYFKTKGETREILYSTDEGDNWSSLPFHSSDLKVYGLMTEPNANTTIFTLFGSEKQEHRWLIIKVDLRNAFNRTCTPDDYKFWAPSSQDGDSLMPCLMGMQQTFQRRAPKVNCYNGKNYERPVRTEVCPCNHWDFECDFGFTRLNRKSPCVYQKSLNQSESPYDIPKECPPGEFYNRTTGYRKIEGDVCVGGYESRYLPQTIPCPFNELNSFLLVAQRDRISRIDLDSGKRSTVPVEDLKNVIAIDFDMKHNCVFFADIMSDKIGRQCLNGNETAEILVETELASVEGMSYDWLSEMLFFVDGTRSKIEAVKTSTDEFGRMRVTIIDSEKLAKPRGIVVHPIEGYLFWTEWSTNKPSLSRSNLDGSNIRVLFTKPDVIWPNGVTIDYFAQRVYWVDASKDYIGSCDLNGKSFVKVLQQDSRVAHPFAVAVYKDQMFWDDWKMNSIFSADKDHGIMIESVAFQMTHLMDLKVYAHSLQEGTNACVKNNHTCSHICVGAPKGGYSCLCPEGMHMSPSKNECLCPGDIQPFHNKTCAMRINTCAPGFFTCENKVCVPAAYRCDGGDDCGDRSDEQGCSTSKNPPCPPHTFTCKVDDKCIPEYFACDFDIDCDDGSDEEGCKFNDCMSGEFRCKNGRCINQRWKCDGEDDCRDKSDEEDCPSPNITAITCKPDEYRCTSNGQCIPNQWKCDNDYDCPDGSDESESECKIKDCDMWEFNCGDGKCIYKSWRCDGDKDCKNGSDEENCTQVTPPAGGSNLFPSVVCHDWMFKCSNNKCIPMWWKCDSVNDCGDDSDEHGCANKGNRTVSTTTPRSVESTTEKRCLINQFECNNGDCISKRYVCDGIVDCSPDGEDEKNCPPNTKEPCGEGNFRCRTDHTCLPMAKYCDQVIHCSDGSDEEDCDHKKPSTPVEPVHCHPAYFNCDNTCVLLMKRCDTKVDCYDGSDEEHCDHVKRVYQVNRLIIENRSLNETSFILYWWLTFSSPRVNIKFLPSIALAGTDAWQNHTDWISERQHQFTDLKPYTKYNLTVYAKVDGEPPAPPYLYMYVTTSEGVPSEPLDVNVTQKNGSRIQVSWSPPKDPSGKLVSYNVYYRPQTQSVGPAQMIKVHARENSIVLESYFKVNTTYEFWVRAKNGKHESPSSKMVDITFDDLSNIDFLQQLMLDDVQESSVTLKWQEAKGADGYIIQPVLPQPYPRIEPLKTNDTKIEIKNMVAGVLYTFKVSAFVKNYVGRAHSVKITLKGDPLPEVSHLKLKYEGDFVRITWKEPRTNLKNLTYGVYYGTSVHELFEKPRVITQDLSANLTKLMPCESYLLSVGIVGPVGPGQLGRNPMTLETSLNDKKPPRDLVAEIDPNNRTLTITWQHNCPISESYPPYLITVTELVMNKTQRVELKRQPNKKLSHYITNIPYGAEYNISVETSLKDAEPAYVSVKAPKLHGPRQLKVWPERNGSFVVYWKELEHPYDFPFTYEVVIYEGLWSNRTAEYPGIVNRITGKTPPIIINPDAFGGEASLGKIFTFGIRVRTADGYMSSISETENVEVQPDAKWLSEIMPTSTYAWLVIVPIVLVISLVLIILYLIQRHRRLQNSFSRFANSHYDTKTGATRIGDTFDDDERPNPNELSSSRFADDEPLVMA